jgi:chaperonin GroES
MVDYRQQLLGDLIAVELEVEDPYAAILTVGWNQSLRGRVVAVGQGRPRDDGTLVPMACKVGDTVTFGPAVGMVSVYEGVPIRIMRDSDVDGVVES